MPRARDPHDSLPTLLIVEDDPDLGPLIAEVLQDDYTTTLVADGSAAFSAASSSEFDAMIVDRRLPVIDGVELVERLRRSGLSTPIIMLTALGSVTDRVTGLDAGADDYLTKPFDFAELAARLRALLRVHGDGAEVFFVGDWEFRPASRLINSPYEGRKMLTDTETQLLLLLARSPDETFSRERILRAVFPSGDSIGTVDTYVHYIRRKTERDLITTVRGRGYRLGEP